jgi:Fur family transcriptional regulator, peroxide stress response regulator
MIELKEIRSKLAQHKLKVTPQRIAVFEAIVKLNNHPTADNIIEFIRQEHPNIAVGTVYNTLETFVKKGMIEKIRTDEEVMRYDALTERHHHLYSRDSRKIGDYFDNDLNVLINNYFQQKTIPGFEVENVVVNIIGKFKS